MIEQKDYYKILNISREADQKDIKKAYRKLAKKYHPDMINKKNSEVSIDKFKEITEAYEILSNPDKRERYNEYGHSGIKEEDFNFDDFARNGFDGFDDIFNKFFSQQYRNKPRTSQKGADLQLIMEISLKEAAFGAKKKIKISRINRGYKLKVSIPAGVKEGMKLRIANKGEPGKNEGPNGDLYIIIKIKDNEVFERKDDNLYCEIPISIFQATLGDKILVPTLNKNVTFDIPEGTQAENLFRLKNKGMKHFNKHGYGDLLIKPKIVIPKNLTDEQKNLMKKLEKLITKNN